MTNARQLILISANKRGGRGHWSYDDVRLGDASGEVIARIFLAPQSPQGRNWFWTITERAPQKPTERGYAPCREDAMAAFKSAWDPMPKGTERRSRPAATYPGRLAVELKERFPGHAITVLNRGVGGEEIVEMLKWFDSDVIAAKPDLVLWQSGTRSKCQFETRSRARLGCVKTLRLHNGQRSR